MRDGGQSPFAEMYEKVFEYPPATQPISESFDIKQHPWLGGEPTWQAVVNERLRRSALRAQFEFGLDVAGMFENSCSGNRSAYGGNEFYGASERQFGDINSANASA